MRVASITMVGQFPEGIGPHVRNLRWALSPDDHIFIVTTPKIIADFDLKGNHGLTFIPFNGRAGEFINFWRKFPGWVEEYDIRPEWFLFMEADIWFFAKPVLPDREKVIHSYLPLGDYRNVLVGDKVYHPRVWEGAQLFHRSVVEGAIDFGVDFSFVRNTFVDRNREKYEAFVGGGIGLSMYNLPDTMDEFCLYCALEAKTKVIQRVKAVHLRGPESLCRKFNDIRAGASWDRLTEVQRAVPYIDVVLVIAVYYMVGLWEDIEDVVWIGVRDESKKDVDKILASGTEWMSADEFTRLNYLRGLWNAEI